VTGDAGVSSLAKQNDHARRGAVLAAAVFAHGMAGMDGDGLAGFGEDDADGGRRS
jgi:hypothetical protein